MHVCTLHRAVAIVLLSVPVWLLRYAWRKRREARQEAVEDEDTAQTLSIRMRSLPGPPLPLGPLEPWLRQRLAVTVM